MSHYFWEDGVNTRGGDGRRFNMLLLEAGEYFLEERGVIWLPMPGHQAGAPVDSEQSFEDVDSMRSPGTLKVCSRCLVYEPDDASKPLVKYPFRSVSKVSHFMFPLSYQHAVGEESVRECIVVQSERVLEMKEGNRIGPYLVRSELQEAIFILTNSDANSLIERILTLQEIFLLGPPKSLQKLEPLVALPSSSDFDLVELLDFHERLLLNDAVAARSVTPLILQSGFFMITDARIYFQSSQLNNTGANALHMDLANIRCVYKKSHLRRKTGLELISTDGSSCLFTFDDERIRNSIHDVIVSHAKGIDWSTSNASDKDGATYLRNLTDKWQRRELSNFDYIMHLNYAAGRSLKDIAQYPVFPHVITDFTSLTLDLDDESIYRDLSKPIGALNPKRLDYFKERMSTMPSEGNAAEGVDPPFLYGTHYSTPGYVLYYLVRVAPEHMLCLQNGKFDSPDRMFISVRDSWLSCLENPTDVKELIPEFFGSDGTFLTNTKDLDLGIRQTGKKLGDVELPPWASSPEDFVAKQAQALESDYVSAHLHEWIDLIFGSKQRGEAAKRADNLFYYLTYEGSVDEEKVTDTAQRRALEVQMQEFGQTPSQLFAESHPARSEAASA